MRTTITTSVAAVLLASSTLIAPVHAQGAFSAPVQNSFTISFDEADPVSPGPSEFSAQGAADDYDGSYAGERATWGSFGGGPDTITADIVADIGPNGSGDNAARLAVTDSTPGGYFASLSWQVKGLVLGNSLGQTASGDEPIPDFDLGLTVTVPVRTNIPDARFRINFDTGSGTRSGQYEADGGTESFVQGNIPGLIENYGSGSRVLKLGPGSSDPQEIGSLPVDTWGTETLVGGFPVADGESPSSINGWNNASFEPFFSRSPRSFNLTRVGVTYPGGGLPGEVLVSEWTMSGVDVLKYHPADFNYDEMVDDADIDMLFAAIAALELNNSLPPVPDNNFNGILDFEPVFGVNRIPHADVTLPEKFSLTKTDNVLDLGDVDELVLNILQTQYGDLDLDGNKDGSDRDTLVANLGSSGGWADGDLNGDGIVDSADLAIFDDVGGASGDFDGDGDVDGSDFLAWQRGESPNSLSSADLAEWEGAFGGNALAAATAVPEPTTAWLGLIAALALLVPRKPWLPADTTSP